VRCWGRLGYDAAVSIAADAPREVQGVSGAIAIAATETMACAIVEGGAVRCWGAGESSSVEGVVGATQLSADYDNVCAIVAGGEVNCWTGNTPPKKIEGVSGATSITVRLYGGCATLASDEVLCWRAKEGSVKATGIRGAPKAIRVRAQDTSELDCFVFSGGNAPGTVRCFDGSKGWSEVSTGKYFASFEAMVGVRDVVGSSENTCALLKNGGVQCWGPEVMGGLGDGAPAVRRVVAADQLPGVKSVTLGSEHGCVLTAEGRVWCWGANNKNQLGDDSKIPSSEPRPLLGLPPAVDIAAGAYHTCAALASGEVRCWGSNDLGGNQKGQLGDSSVTQSLSGVKNAIAVEATGGESCALLSDQQAVCWGRDQPLNKPTSKPVTALSVTLSGHCFVRPGGAVECNQWPSAVVEGATKVTASGQHGCALVGGDVLCWGYNGHGELGSGQHLGKDNVPAVTVSGISGVIDVRTSSISDIFLSTCALLQGGDIRCWGSNWRGQLGDGTTTDSSKPALVRGVSGAVSLAVGASRSCAVLAGGDVVCWGLTNPGLYRWVNVAGLPANP